MGRPKKVVALPVEMKEERFTLVSPDAIFTDSKGNMEVTVKYDGGDREVVIKGVKRLMVVLAVLMMAYAAISLL